MRSSFTSLFTTLALVLALVALAMSSSSIGASAFKLTSIAVTSSNGNTFYSKSGLESVLPRQNEAEAKIDGNVWKTTRDAVMDITLQNAPTGLTSAKFGGNQGVFAITVNGKSYDPVRMTNGQKTTRVNLSALELRCNWINTIRIISTVNYGKQYNGHTYTFTLLNKC